MFDDVVASATVCSLLFCELALDYAVSGLAQPLMMACMLAGLHFLLSACRAKTEKRITMQGVWVVLSMFMMTLMCLAGWLGIAPALGYFIFCAVYFRPVGTYGFIGLGILFACSIPTMINNYNAVGDVFGNAF